jgi:hypothetical protein
VSSAIHNRTSREKKTKSHRDRLTCLQAAMSRKDGWTEEQIARLLDEKTEATPRNYVRDGLRDLGETPE